MKIGHHGRFGDARIDDDQQFRRVLLQALEEHRMVVGDVGADQDDHIGLLHILVSAGRPIAAERALVAGHGRRHAERGVATEILGTEAELHQFAERVELFGEQLAGADHAQRFGSVTLLHVAELGSHRRQRFRPGYPDQLAFLAQQGIFEAILGVERVVFREPFGAQFAEVGLVILVASHGDSLTVLYANVHATTDGAVTARRLHPLVRNLAGVGVAGDGVGGVRVLLLANIETKEALQTHAACPT